MNKNFYKEFADIFRGSPEIIKERLQVYLPFIEPLKDIYPDAEVVDLGCGRGEWLAMMGDNGFSAQGVDLDDGMLAACQEQDLRVQAGDALSFLKNLDNESQAVITGFHLVEHIPFNDLLLLVKEALRVLVPAGILILETPNPENIVVGSSSFYIDPTHNRPIPPELLMFVVENNKFGRVKSLRLQESLECDSNKLSLLSVLNGVSPDYAVVAQKHAEPSMMDKFSEKFAKDFGYSLMDMVTKYDTNLQENIVEAIDPVSQRNNKLEEALNKVDQRNNKLEEALNKVDQRNNKFEDELASVYASRSWRYTKYLRYLMFYLKRILSWSANCLKRIIRGLMAKAIKFLSCQPRLRSRIILTLNHYPRVKLRVKTLLNKGGLSTILYTPLKGSGGSNINLESKISSSNLKFDDPAIKMSKPKGVNYEKKSPLEKSFE